LAPLPAVTFSLQGGFCYFFFPIGLLIIANMEKASHKSQIKYLSVMQNNAFAYSLKI